MGELTIGVLNDGTKLKGECMTERMALFPLNTVLLPGCVLDLQIFEPRYLDMVSRCFRQNAGFVVVTLEEGAEAGPGAVRFKALGCEARIIDWERRDNGLLGIRVEGGRRAEASAVEVASDGLLSASVDWLVEQPDAELLASHADLLALHTTLLEHPIAAALKLPAVAGSQQRLAWQLAYLLPLDVEEKLELLAQADPLLRLQQIERWLQSMQA